MLIAFFHLVFAVFDLFLLLFIIGLEGLNIISKFCLSVRKTLDVVFKVFYYLRFVLKLSLKVLVFESIFGDGFLLSELSGIQASICSSKLFDLVLENAVFIFHKL